LVFSWLFWGGPWADQAAAAELTPGIYADSDDFLLNATAGESSAVYADSSDFILSTAATISRGAFADSIDFTLNTTAGEAPGSQADSHDFTVNTAGGPLPGIYADSGDFTLNTTGLTPGPPAIVGVLSFANTNPELISLLQAPGNEGMRSCLVTAVSRPPAPPVTAATPEVPASALTATPYRVSVTGDSNGIAYAVTARVALQNNAQSYYFNTRTSAVVVADGPAVVLDFQECLGVVEVRFLDSAGAPTPVDGGQILVSAGAAGRLSIPPGASQARLYLRGGASHALAITVNRGTNYYRDRMTFVLNTNLTPVCDGFTAISMLVPEPAALGRIEGEVDMLGEFEIAVDGSDSANLPDSTGIIAFNGPFQNQRWAAISGVPLTAPSSGAFVLSNVAPSNLAPGSPGYAVYAQMYFRTNHQIQYFRSPTLGSGSNAAVQVLAGQTTSLGDVFVFNPGTLRGRVLLQGPPERPGDVSQFRGLNHASDVDANRDGIPDLLGSFGLYWTSFAAEGVNRRAPGATWTTASGYASTDFDGAVSPTTGAYVGNYELRLAGLNSQPGLWSPKYLNLVMSHPGGLSASDYYSSSLAITDRRGLELPIVSGQAVTQDVAYCFSEVRVFLSSTLGPFYAPEVRASSGSFTNTDFWGDSANYGVVVSTAAGTPLRAADASTRGEIVLYLPQGIYRLLPSVIYANSNQGRTGLAPIDLTVGCQERIWVGDFPLRITFVGWQGGGPQVAFPTRLGETYQLERSPQITPPDWHPVGSLIPGTGAEITSSDLSPLRQGQAFYRIRATR
jgi:hypothetical protein